MLQQVGGLENWTNRWWCFHGFSFSTMNAASCQAHAIPLPNQVVLLLGAELHVVPGTHVLIWAATGWTWLDLHLSWTGSQMFGLLGTLNTGQRVTVDPRCLSCGTQINCDMLDQCSAMRQWRGPGAPPVLEEAFRCGNCELWCVSKKAVEDKLKLRDFG